MNQILYGLFNGNIIPWERRGLADEKYHEIMGNIENKERYFMEKMSPDDCQRFQELSDLYTELLSAEEGQLFSYAFSLGLLLVLDVMEQAQTISNN